jgi:hypothetical protein
MSFILKLKSFLEGTKGKQKTDTKHTVQALLRNFKDGDEKMLRLANDFDNLDTKKFSK